MKLYHATPDENVESILEDGIVPGWDSSVHLTSNKERAICFMQLRGLKSYAVFGIDQDPAVFDSAKLSPFYDGTLSGGDCFVYEGQAYIYRLRAVRRAGGNDEDGLLERMDNRLARVEKQLAVLIAKATA